MKKMLLALLALASAVACTKQAPTTTPIVRVSFSVGEFGYFPTKGLPEAISATLPETLDLTLTNSETGAVYTTTTGTSIELPVGTYAVTGGYTPEATTAIYGNSVFLSKTPKVSVSQDVQIMEGVSSYTLQAVYQSCALAVRASEVTRWTGAANREGFTIDAMETDGYLWTFLSGELGSSRYFYTYLQPVTGQQKSFTIVADPALQMNFSDALVVSPGRWYILRVSDTATQSGSFGIAWPEWSQG